LQSGNLHVFIAFLGRAWELPTDIHTYLLLVLAVGPGSL
jgi:hypothetical protein